MKAIWDALDLLEEQRTALGFNQPSHFTLMAQVRTRLRAALDEKDPCGECSKGCCDHCPICEPREDDPDTETDY